MHSERMSAVMKRCTVYLGYLGYPTPRVPKCSIVAKRGRKHCVCWTCRESHKMAAQDFRQRLGNGYIAHARRRLHVPVAFMDRNPALHEADILAHQSLSFTNP